ncbi:MAG: hypothetical protein AB7S69_10255 [Salinivirgaceae bacterium]
MRNIVVLILTAIMVYTCEPEPEVPDTEYAIHNISSHHVEVTLFNAGIPDQSLKNLTFLLPATEGISYFYLSSNKQLLLEPADSALIKFTEGRQIIYRRKDGHLRNILDLSSWEYRNGVTTEHIYTYSITNEDYDNAAELK